MQSKLLLDPWSPDYEAPIQTGGPDVAATGEIDPSVEVSDWKAIRPGTCIPIKRICFVDGVRRIEARVLAQNPGIDEDIGLGSAGLRSAAECISRQTGCR